MDSIKVSIIIPVYNVEKYLAECLESVIHQTLKEIEIICVNDGSTDSSLEILKKYQRKDNRIKIISQENKGESVARNFGFQEATGEYIYYLDSDDFIDPTALEELYIKANRDKLDILSCDGRTYYETKELEKRLVSTQPSFQKRFQYEGIYTGKEFFIELISNRDYQVQVSLYLVRRDFIEREKISFYKNIFYEDNLYTLELLLKGEKVGNIKKTLFHHRVRANSIMTSERITFQHFYSALRVYFEELKLIEQINESRLRDAIATQIEEIYKRVKHLYQIVQKQFLIQENIELLNGMEELEKILMRQLGLEFQWIPFFPFGVIPQNAKIVLYGAGTIGRYYYRQIQSSNYCKVEKWIDKRYIQISQILNEDIANPEDVNMVDYEFILLAMQNKNEVEDVRQFLLKKNIEEEKIIWIPPRYINI